MTRRPYQKNVLECFIKDPARLWALLWERQAGKSTTLADFALYEMLRHQNHTVVYASASLLLAQEILPFAPTKAFSRFWKPMPPVSNNSPTPPNPSLMLKPKSPSLQHPWPNC
jgi:hypothetical protein